MPKAPEGPATIAILGGNPVIGKALESLLASTEYVARLYSEYPEADAEPLGGARIAIVLPASSSKRRDALMHLIKTTKSTKNLPVVELTTTPNESGHDNRLPWPCSIEVLRRSIDETLQDS